ncbi:MAG TPA: hypothetical protein VK752_11405 [Bryobacteraceae bacterium]|jgi:hypothetical protein|nr:hypothetical protein [Bryobacteraceae bacterium]
MPERKAFEVIAVNTDEPRNVTASDPLIINDVVLTLPWVRIVDGDIIAKVETTTNFGKLEKLPVPAKGGKHAR